MSNDVAELTGTESLEKVKAESDEILKAYQGMKVEAINFKLFKSHIEVIEANGFSKALSIGDFISLINNTIGSESDISSFLLPANCFIFGTKGNEMKLSCYYPGKVRKITFLGYDQESKSTELEVPFPNIIISHKLIKKGDKWEWTDARYLATSKRVGELDGNFLFNADPMHQIWTLPFSNIYAEGRMCYGHNSIPRTFTLNLRGLDWHFAVLYNSPFNSDLGIPSVSTRQEPRNWFKKLSKLKTFPYEELPYGPKTVVTKENDRDLTE